jgi:hypothetical protein
MTSINSNRDSHHVLPARRPAWPAHGNGARTSPQHGAGHQILNDEMLARTRPTALQELFCAGVTLSVVVGCLIHHLIEQPVTRYLNQWLRASPTNAAPVVVATTTIR